jgi:hypothetical protein
MGQRQIFEKHALTAAITICFSNLSSQIGAVQISEETSADNLPENLNPSMKSIHPPLELFVNELGKEKIIAQLLIRQIGQQGQSYELLHHNDANKTKDELKELKLEEAQFYLSFTDTSVFRPIKGAPDMRSGWRLVVQNHQDLELALQAVYPGFISDNYAVKKIDPIPVTSYTDFAERQTGMYRNAKLLTEERAQQAVEACCGATLCLKRRYWSVPGLDADTAGAEKSEVPCLEPCAVMLEWGRKVVRMDQVATQAVESGASPLSWSMTPDEAKSLLAALELAQSTPDNDGRFGDVAAPLNPRRLEWVAISLRKLIEAGEIKSTSRESH